MGVLRANRPRGKFFCDLEFRTDGGWGKGKIFYSPPFLEYPAFLEATDLPRFELGSGKIASKTQLQRLP